MLGLKTIFTWWNKYTFGTLINTIFFGKLVGKDNFGNKYYTNRKKDKRWVIYKSEIESTRIPSGWYLWMHQIEDKCPALDLNKKKYKWQKDHQENQTGKKNNRTARIKKNIKKKYEIWN